MVCEELCSCPDISERPWRAVEKEFQTLAAKLTEMEKGVKENI